MKFGDGCGSGKGCLLPWQGWSTQSQT